MGAHAGAGMGSRGPRVREAVRLRLGVGGPPDTASCGLCGNAVLEPSGAHPACCATGEATRGHNHVRNIVHEFSLIADASAEREPLGLVFLMLRPADILTSAALDGCTATQDIGTTASEHSLCPHRMDVLRATPRSGQGGLAAHRSPNGAAPRGWVCPGRATADAPGHRHRARPPGGTHEPRVLADDVAPGRRQRLGQRRRLSGARSPSFSEPPASPRNSLAPVRQNGVAEQPGRPLNASGAHHFEPWCAVDVCAPGVARI